MLYVTGIIQHTYNYTISHADCLLCHTPLGGALHSDDRFVCPSVCPVPVPKLRTEGFSGQAEMARGKPVTWVTRDPI